MRGGQWQEEEKGAASIAPPLPELRGLGREQRTGRAALRTAAACAGGVLLLAAANGLYVYGPLSLQVRLVTLYAALPWVPAVLYGLLLLALLPGALVAGFAGLTSKTRDGMRAVFCALVAALAAAWILATAA